jgi:glycosyltransferase involved in cell wall biosynthesis
MKKMIKDEEITLVIPAKNEKESISYVLNELSKYKFKIFVILEKTDYETLTAVQEFKNQIIFQQKKEKGYGSAIIKGIKKVKTKYFCIFNADGSFNPNEIRNMKKTLIYNDLDIVFASRYLGLKSGSDDDTILTFLGNKIFTFIGEILYQLQISDILYTFILAKSKKVKNLQLTCHDFRLCVELPIKAKLNKLNFKDCRSYERKRYSGIKKVNELKDGFLILLYMIKFFFLKLKL